MQITPVFHNVKDFPEEDTPIKMISSLTKNPYELKKGKLFAFQRLITTQREFCSVCFLTESLELANLSPYGTPSINL